MTQTVTLGALLAGSYLLGSFPFGLWIARAWKGVDVREHGSRNIGATNVLRVCGPVVGGLVFAFDVVKGLAPPLVGAALGLASPWQILAALLAIVGHNYSVWLGFKGGKGIATSLGALLGVAPKVGLTAFGIFGIEMLVLGYVSLGSLLAAVSLAPLMLLYYPGDWYRCGFGAIACLMALYKHRANIQRLRAGTEPKLRLFGGRRAAGVSEHAEGGPESSRSPAENTAVVSGGSAVVTGTSLRTPKEETQSDRTQSQDAEKEPRANAPQ